MVGQATGSLPYTSQAVYACLEQLWVDEKCWPLYIQAMQQALSLDAGPGPVSPLSYIHLTGLCCQAAGGKPQQTVNVAAAWALLYTAAHLFDSVEDGEVAFQDTATTINAATGLIFTAIRALAISRTTDIPDQIRLAVIEDFARTALEIGCGQHADLVGSASSLAQCWKVVEAKSGACFALACRAGAMLAGAPAATIEAYSQFGQHLGVIIQITNDLQGVQTTDGKRNDLMAGRRSLPVWYTLSVLSPEKQITLLSYLQAARHDPTAKDLAQNVIEKSGAALYLDIETRRHCLQALTHIRQIEPPPEPGKQLTDLLNNCCPLNQCDTG